jgi:hypothetical protein
MTHDYKRHGTTTLFAALNGQLPRFSSSAAIASQKISLVAEFRKRLSIVNIT